MLLVLLLHKLHGFWELCAKKWAADAIVRIFYDLIVGFPGGSVEKNPPARQGMQEMWVQSLGGEEP